MNKTEKETLIKLNALYDKVSKHSSYQSLPPRLANTLENRKIEKPKYEFERMRAIERCIPFKGATVLDIGANTGYFTFESVSNGASHVTAFEGNSAHAEFLNLATELLGYRDSVSVEDRYFDFTNSANKPKVDTCLLFNVLHHVGDDYGDAEISLTDAKEKILDSINMLADQSHWLALQLGYCWKGNPRSPLFAEGTKSEQLDFVRQGTEKHWELRKVLVAELNEDKVQYRQLNDSNSARRDSLGEFLNRPIFILESRR